MGTKKVKFWKNMLCLPGNLKANVEIAVKSVISHFNAKRSKSTMLEPTVTQPGQIIAYFVVKLGMERRIV
jgi:hypothetical protein